METQIPIFERPLTLRERLAIKMMLIIIKIVKPTSSEYGMDTPLKEFETMITDRQVSISVSDISKKK